MLKAAGDVLGDLSEDRSAPGRLRRQADRADTELLLMLKMVKAARSTERSGS